MLYRSETELLKGFDNEKDAFLGRESRLKEMSRDLHSNQVHKFEIVEEPKITNPEVGKQDITRLSKKQ